jgi:predicted NAD-dependent protein-ADP-ribosyltransferase YbiA (DUF1768 family)
MKPMFYFYSKSADTLPGTGANERLGDCSAGDFEELRQYSNWRKILSNFSCGHFEYAGSHYRTAEHAFQGKKIGLVDPTKGGTFALESNSRLSVGDGDLARKNRKMILLKERQLQQWDQIKEFVLEEILRAKFTQEETSKRILLATKDAELWHGARGVPKSRQLSLEKIRLELQQAIGTGSESVEIDAEGQQPVEAGRRFSTSEEAKGLEKEDGSPRPKKISRVADKPTPNLSGPPIGGGREKRGEVVDEHPDKTWNDRNKAL